MWKRLILKDAFRVWMLLTGCLVGGFLINKMRAKPLPMCYSPRDVHLDLSVKDLGEKSSQPVLRGGDVSLEEVVKISASRTALILDARPEVFYRVGHIPSALSLPRDNFEGSYRILAPTLRERRNQLIVVYCSANDCGDSKEVGDALARLGYPHVRLFRGGWSDWDGENLPEEKE